MSFHLFKIFFISIVTISFAITGCNQKPKTPDHLKVTVDKTSKEYASAYICPMHCEGSGSHEPGTCPVCGMDYVHNKDFQEADEMIHEDADTDSTMVDDPEPSTNESSSMGFACPMHPEVTGGKGDVCGICGMELVAQDDEVNDHAGQLN